MVIGIPEVSDAARSGLTLEEKGGRGEFIAGSVTPSVAEERTAASYFPAGDENSARFGNRASRDFAGR